MTTTTTNEPINRPQEANLLDRQGLRFLLNHHNGRLLTDDPHTGEPHVTPVHYVADGDGTLLTHLPADSDQAGAIERGGRTLLSVRAAGGPVPTELVDADGLVRPEAIWHVQAEAAAELLRSPEQVERVLRRQTASALQRSGHESPTAVAEVDGGYGGDALAGLVAVRLRPVRLHVRFREAGSDGEVAAAEPAGSAV